MAPAGSPTKKSAVPSRSQSVSQSDTSDSNVTSDSGDTVKAAEVDAAIAAAVEATTRKLDERFMKQQEMNEKQQRLIDSLTERLSEIPVPQKLRYPSLSKYRQGDSPDLSRADEFDESVLDEGDMGGLPSASRPGHTRAHFSEPISHSYAMPERASRDTSVPHSASSYKKEPKLPEPDKFNGDPQKLDRFLADLQNRFEVQPRQHPSEKIKVIVAMGYLTERAAQWADPIRKNFRPELSNSFNLFASALRTQFEDPNRITSMTEKLFQLKQGNYTAEAYSQYFENLCYEAGYPAELWGMKFYLGLSERLKLALAGVQGLDNNKYQVVRKMAINLDQRLRTAQSEMGMQNRGARPQVSTQPTPASYSAPATPAFIPRTQQAPGRLFGSRGPLDDDEKKRRREQGLCLYCGGAGHIARNCSKKPTTFAATQEFPEFAMPEDDLNAQQVSTPSNQPPEDLLELSGSEQLANSRHVVVQGRLGGKAVRLMLDTGATANFVHQDLILEIEKHDQRDLHRAVFSIDGKVMVKANEATIMTKSLMLPGFGTHKIQVIGAPTKFYDAVLGLPWFRHINPDVDWKTEEVKPRLTDIQRTVESEMAKLELLKAKGKSVLELRPDNQRVLATTMIEKTNIQNPVILKREQGEEDHFHFHFHATLCDEPTKQTIEIPPQYAQCADVFSKEKAMKMPLPRGVLDHAIDLKEGAMPPCVPAYRKTEREKQESKKQIAELLQTGWISTSKSPVAVQVLFQEKKDNSLRLCCDYRSLNDITVKDKYPMPNIDDILDSLREGKFFTKLNIRNAFHLIRIREGDQWKTAFRTDEGLFEWSVMPFGLCNAPATFQRFIDTVLQELLGTKAYIDDIVIHGKTREECRERTIQALERLRGAGLYAKLEKCEFEVQEIAFLGFIISEGCLRMDPARVRTIVDWPAPTKLVELQAWDGFINFYRRFIPRFAERTKGYSVLKKKDTRWEWTAEAQASFDNIKNEFKQGHVTQQWNPDYPAEVTTDASGYAIAGELAQRINGVKRPVAFWSRKMTPEETRYGTPDQELMAVVKACQHWRHYLEGAKHTVQIFTDHANLRCFHTLQKPNKRQAGYISTLANFDYKIFHLPGKRNPADGPSRRADYQDKDGVEPLKFDLHLAATQKQEKDADESDVQDADESEVIRHKEGDCQRLYQERAWSHD